ncbi:MAG TPA: 23S rRNA (uracil(1939)-C(5))-methyltransferase RlmD [Steroidobacteraceae bacterium]|nr:23S rRNA (uracil(1939)-C(5))-methyltransferase RlmD [Steroidobacteraceae bacterium]
MNAGARTRPERRIETAEIIDLSQDGRGVARVDGKTVFIDDALPGERVEWLRTKRSRNFDEGRLERVLEAAPDRVEPRCAHFGVCGGCVLQHLAPARQLEFKQRQLYETLTRIGKVTPAEVLPPLQGDVWNYRRRARLAARWVPKKERTVLGFRERSTSYIADVRRCEVLLSPVGSMIEPLSLLLTALSVRNRVPQIEVAVADNAVALVVRVLEELTSADRDLLLQFEREHGVQIYVQPGGYETVAPLSGAAVPLEYRLPQFDVTVRFQPSDFVQVNGELNARMVARAVELLAPVAGERVLDLFCGLGNFSLPLARSGAQVVGVEGDAGLVARARANAVLNGVGNIEFVSADLAQPSVCDASWARRSYDKVLLDPPRAGAQAVLPILARSGAKVVLYISCHPGSLARDAGILVHEHGFTLRAAGVMDMFPHTAHVESAALFMRGSRP